MTVRVVSAPWVLLGRPRRPQRPSSLSPSGGEGQGEGAVRDGAVALEGDVVVAVGPRAEVEASFGRSERRDAILLPALVNAHLHLELSHLAGRVTGGDGLAGWIGRFVDARRERGDAGADDAMAAGARALVDAGVAAVGDVSNTLGSLAPLAAAGLAGTVFHEVFGSRPEWFAAARTAGASARAAAPVLPGLRVVESPHAVYSTDPDGLAALLAGPPAALHLAEDPAERAFVVHGTGPFAELRARWGSPPPRPGWARSPVALAAAHLARGWLLVHCVDLDREDIGLLARSGATVVLCPRSNAYISGRIPNLPGLLAAGIPLAVGTDSLASSPSLSPLAEVAALRRAYPAVPPSRLVALLWNGPAVGAPWVGRLAPGFAPGVVAAPLGSASVEDPYAFLAGAFGEEERPLEWIAKARPT